MFLSNGRWKCGGQTEIHFHALHSVIWYGLWEEQTEERGGAGDWGGGVHGELRRCVKTERSHCRRISQAFVKPVFTSRRQGRNSGTGGAERSAALKFEFVLIYCFLHVSDKVLHSFCSRASVATHTPSQMMKKCF